MSVTSAYNICFPECSANVIFLVMGHSGIFYVGTFEEPGENFFQTLAEGSCEISFNVPVGL